MAETYLPLAGHLHELRKRLLWMLGAWAGMTLAAFAWWDRLWDALTGPVGRPLVYLSPAGGFVIACKLSMMAGAVLASPVILYQAWAFLAPALREHEERTIRRLSALTSGLFVLGVACGWVALRPLTRYLLTFETPSLVPMLTAESYLSFALFVLLAGGLTFQLPPAMGLLAAWGWLSTRRVVGAWRGVVVGAVVGAAVLTPTPDAVTQLVTAGLFLALFAVGTVFVWWMERRRERHAVAEAEPAWTEALPPGSGA